MPKNKVLIVTGGGHVHFGPGIRTMIEEGTSRGWEMLGSLYGWRGVDTSPGEESIVDLSSLSHEQLARMDCVGSSPLFSSRTKADGGRVQMTLGRYGVTHVIAMGGEDTLSVNPGVPLVGWPKTMDNNHGPPSKEWDLSPGTYFDIGYPTAVERVARETASAHANAQTNSSVHIIIPFGRNQDFVAVGATAYGAADFMIPGEIEVSFEDFYKKLQEARLRNADRYHCRPFAVVVMPEGVNKGDAVGFFGDLAPRELADYAQRAKKDAFGHRKLQPELMSMMVADSLIERSKGEQRGKRMDKVTAKVSTYHLRDGPANRIDRLMAAETGRRCIELIEEGREGMMATVRWSPEEAEFVTGEVPIRDAIRERFVMGTGFFDYDNTWRPTDRFMDYAIRFAGIPPRKGGLVHESYALAKPIGAL